MNVTEKRMGGVCLENLLIAVPEGSKESGSLKTVQFDTDGVGGFAEFGLQTTQMSLRAAVEEELLQQLDTGLGCDKTI